MLELHAEGDRVLTEEIGEDIQKKGLLDEAGLLKVPHHWSAALLFCSKLVLFEANIVVMSSVYLVNIFRYADLLGSGRYVLYGWTGTA